MSEFKQEWFKSTLKVQCHFIPDAKHPTPLCVRSLVVVIIYTPNLFRGLKCSHSGGTFVFFTHMLPTFTHFHRL